MSVCAAALHCRRDTDCSSPSSAAQVEQAFFQMWWARQPESIRDQVRGLVKNGQLEFINGGWCMHDEANTHCQWLRHLLLADVQCAAHNIRRTAQTWT